MNEVRLIIFVVGVLVMAGIYLHWRFMDEGGRPPRERDRAPRGWVEDAPADAPRWQEPSLDDSELDALDEDDEQLPLLEDVAVEGHGNYYRETAADRPTQGDAEQHLLILHVAAHRGRYLNGSDIADTLDQMGFGFADNGIFHFFGEPDADGEPVLLFSAANMLEPGTFDAERMGELYTPGLTLFAVLPGQVPGPQVLDQMVDTAGDMARRLGAEVLDASRETLTGETVAELEEQVAAL